MSKHNIFIFLVGACSGLAFAPVFFLPGMLTGVAYLCYQTRISITKKENLYKGYIFGFGHFLIGIYWVSIGVSVYIEEFWWAIPFALFGLPLILACFISLTCYLSGYFNNHKYYPFIFSIIWVFFEWVRSWIFTGFPWNLAGYSLSFSPILIQGASFFGIYGLSFVIVLLGSIFSNLNNRALKSSLLYFTIISIGMLVFGSLRLYNNPTVYTDINLRLVQPSIKQSAKWEPSEFLNNLNKLIALSYSANLPDIIIWSEAALTVPYSYPLVKEKIAKLLNNSQTVLITGGVSEKKGKDHEYKIYSVMQAISASGILFEYHKHHLVPFGEYIPFKNLIPVKKLTPGLVDFSKGEDKLVNIEKYHLRIRPLICYEAIFPNLARTDNYLADVMINITNDTWYGNSSGPYQHLHISIMRAVENGLPMVRVANSGVSAVIDPAGRIINSIPLNEVKFLDQKLPYKLINSTFYSKYPSLGFIILIIGAWIIYILIILLTKKIF